MNLRNDKEAIEYLKEYYPKCSIKPVDNNNPSLLGLFTFLIDNTLVVKVHAETGHIMEQIQEGQELCQ